MEDTPYFVWDSLSKTFRSPGNLLSMEFILELLIQLVLEITVQGIFELGGRGIVSLVRKDSKTWKPGLAICGYMLMGTIAGAISIWLVPMHLFASPLMQILNLAITPIVLGFLFEFLGNWRTNHEKSRYAVDRFSYGFTFALTMGLIRFFFAA